MKLARQVAHRLAAQSYYGLGMSGYWLFIHAGCLARLRVGCSLASSELENFGCELKGCAQLFGLY